jgi:hypothetical protein
MKVRVPNSPTRRSFAEDKSWSDSYIAQIKPILGTLLIGPAPYEEDSERNTDLIVLRMDSVRIACRIRAEEYLERYPNDFLLDAWRCLVEIHPASRWL